MASMSESRISRRRSGSVPSTISCMPLRMNGSSMASISSSSASRPSLRARSAKVTIVLRRAPRSGCSLMIAFMYSLGMSMKRFIPTPPKIAPAVPPHTRIRALMLRSIGGATPSMIPAMMMAAAASPIPIAVAAFIVLSSGRPPETGLQPGVLALGLAQRLLDRREDTIGLEGLHDEVLGAELDRLQDLGLLAQGGAHDHLGAGIDGDDLLEGGEAVLLGHGDVQRHDVGAQLLEPLHRLRTVGCLANDLVAAARQG